MSADILARDAVDQLRAPSRRAQPLPHIAIIGDSIANPDFNGPDRTQTPLPNPTNHLKAANGILSWALILSGQRVRAPAASNVWSFPGQETGTILANLPAFLAQMAVKPGAVIIECGTNNVYHNGATATFEAITADWQAIASLLAAQGIRAIFVPILPGSAAAAISRPFSRPANMTSSTAATGG